MITQVKVGYKFVNVSVAVTDDKGKTQDCDSAEVWFYKISQSDGSIALDTNINSDGKVSLVKQDNQIGFWGASINIENLSESEYIVLIKVTVLSIETITVESLSIDKSKTDIGKILQVEKGKWKIENNQMKFYEEDGITALYTFDLFDKDGNPAMQNVFERRLV